MSSHKQNELKKKSLFSWGLLSLLNFSIWQQVAEV